MRDATLFFGGMLVGVTLTFAVMSQLVERMFRTMKAAHDDIVAAYETLRKDAP